MKPIVLSIYGAPDIDLTTFLQGIRAVLGPDQCTLLKGNRYHLSPSKWDISRLQRDLQQLRAGQPVACPPDKPTDVATVVRSAPVVLLDAGGAPAGTDLPALADYTWLIGHAPAGTVDVFIDRAVPPAEWIAQGLAWLSRHGLATAVYPQASALPPDSLELSARMGWEELGQRLARQAYHWAGLDHQGEGLFFFERWIPVDRLINALITASGFGRWGRRGARDLRAERNEVRHPRVPPEFDGFTLLQITDLHLDLETGVVDELLNILPTLTYDLAVVTGDYRNSTRDNYGPSIARTARIIEALKPPRIGILGNHDFVEMVAPLEAHGLPMLLNEGIFIERDSARLLVAGVDDAHFYQTHRLDRVGVSATDNLFRILLSHSPEIWQEAAAHFDLMLSGHTHGGQICLPGGIPIVRNGRCPGRLLAGPWSEGPLHGYTSRGTGCCGVPMRFFCPPEITLHTLRTQTKERDALRMNRPSATRAWRVRVRPGSGRARRRG